MTERGKHVAEEDEENDFKNHEQYRIFNVKIKEHILIFQCSFIACLNE